MGRVGKLATVATTEGKETRTAGAANGVDRWPGRIFVRTAVANA